MIIEIKGILKEKLQRLGGVSKNGKKWSRQDIIVSPFINDKNETGDIVKVACLYDTQDVLDTAEIGDIVTITADLYANGWRNNYYNNVNAKKICISGNNTVKSVGDINYPKHEEDPVGDMCGDLPF